MEYLKIFFHILGFLVIYIAIDYKREKPITSLYTKKGWFIIFLMVFASILLRL